MNYNILTSITVNEQLLYDKEMKRYNQKYKPDWTVQLSPSVSAVVATPFWQLCLAKRCGCHIPQT